MACKNGMILVFVWLLAACKGQTEVSNTYETENLKIERVTGNSFVHISYLDTETYGKVACNGMIVLDEGEAIVYDTPTTDRASKELIQWIIDKTKSKVVAVVATHFHADCLGGLSEFHGKGIPSYASNKTIELAGNSNEILPQNGFDEYLELKIGHKKVINEFMGEGHTLDNIIGYFPDEKVIFGGCLIKSDGAGKGNLNDANVEEWSKTVENLKSKYANVERVIPGHGKVGGSNLLDYTIKLFQNESAD